MVSIKGSTLGPSGTNVTKSVAAFERSRNKHAVAISETTTSSTSMSHVVADNPYNITGATTKCETSVTTPPQSSFFQQLITDVALPAATGYLSMGIVTACGPCQRALGSLGDEVLDNVNSHFAAVVDTALTHEVVDKYDIGTIDDSPDCAATDAGDCVSVACVTNAPSADSVVAAFQKLESEMTDFALGQGLQSIQTVFIAMVSGRSRRHEATEHAICHVDDELYNRYKSRVMLPGSIASVTCAHPTVLTYVQDFQCNDDTNSALNARDSINDILAPIEEFLGTINSMISSIRAVSEKPNGIGVQERLAAQQLVDLVAEVAVELWSEFSNFFQFAMFRLGLSDVCKLHKRNGNQGWDKAWVKRRRNNNQNSQKRSQNFKAPEEYHFHKCSSDNNPDFNMAGCIE